MKKHLIILLLGFLNLGFLLAQRLDYNDPFNNEIYHEDGRRVTKQSLTDYFEKTLDIQGNPTKIINFKLLKNVDEKTRKEYVIYCPRIFRP